MEWKTFEVREFKPNRFITLINGEIVRPSTPFDHKFNIIFQRCQTIDAETVSMAIGFTALTVFFTSQTTLLAIKIIGILAFFSSAAGTIILLDSFILQKIPHIIYRTLEKTSKYPLLRYFQYRFNLYKEWLRRETDFQPIMDIEYAFLTFSIGFELATYALIIWMFIALSTELSSYILTP